MQSQREIALTEENLQEIFALFTSPSNEEKEQVYDPSCRFYFGKQDLTAEYSLTEERKEFAVDAWRAVTYFLHRHGYSLVKDGNEYDPGESSGYEL